MMNCVKIADNASKMISLNFGRNKRVMACLYEKFVFMMNCVKSADNALKMV